MLKLNLLPPNIYEPRKKRIWFSIFLVVWLALAGGLVAWQLSLVNLKAQKTEELQRQEAIVRQVEQTEQEARNTRAMVAPLLLRAQLADEVFRYNRQYPRLYREVRRWTIDTVRYNTMGVAQGMTLQAQAVTRDLDEMARYLQIMLRCPLFTGVSISWSAGGAATPTGGFGAMGMPPIPGGGFSGAPYGAGMPYGAPTAAPGAPPGVPGMPMAGAPSAQRAPQQLAQGITFNVVATLREPITSPVQQLVQQLMSSLGGAGMAGGMGGFGGGMGMPGGMPSIGGPSMMPGAPPGGAGAPLGGRGALAE